MDATDDVKQFLSNNKHNPELVSFLNENVFSEPVGEVPELDLWITHIDQIKLENLLERIIKDLVRELNN